MLIAAVVLFQTVTADALENRLRRDLASLQGVKFGKEGDTLVVRYRMEVVKTPKSSKAVTRMVELVPEERPKLTGFKIETYEFPHKDADPPRPMQAVRTSRLWLRDYGTWKIDAQDRQVTFTDRGRYYYLAWGSKADRKLMEKIRYDLEWGSHSMK